MHMFDKTDFQRIAIAMAGALLLATVSVAGVATGANQGMATAPAATVSAR